ALLGDARRDRRGRRARSLRRRLGSPARLEYGTRTRRPVRGANGRTPGGDHADHGKLARRPADRPHPMTGNRGIMLAAAAAAPLILLLVGGALASFLSELSWYRSLGLDDVFWTRWRGAVIVRGTATVLILSVIAINLMIVTRSLGAIRVRRRYGNIEIAER